MKRSMYMMVLLLLGMVPASSYAQTNEAKRQQLNAEAQQRTVTASSSACAIGNATVDLNINNVRARLYNTGGLFWKGLGNGYTVPQSGGVNAIFASGIWIGGMVNGQRRFAGSTYGPYEYWPGPLDANGNPPADCLPYDRIYKISKTDIQTYQSTGVLTDDMRDWPWQVGAPVQDGDGDPNNYNLSGGDLPKLSGDQMAWWIMNDMGGAKGWSQTAGIGLEVQVTAFAFRRADALNNTTFYRYKVINRGPIALEQAHFGIWSDPDLGYGGDDYVSSDTTLNMAFVYNGTDFDINYGSPPPALGYLLLQGPVGDPDGRDNDKDGIIDEPDERHGMSVFHPYNNNSGTTGNPIGSTDQPYNYLKGFWKDGTPMTFGGNGYGGSAATRYMYPGNPVNGSYWSEENIDGQGGRSTPGDRRFVMSSGPFTLASGEEEEIVFGIYWSQGFGGRLASVRQLVIDTGIQTVTLNTQVNGEGSINQVAGQYKTGTVATLKATPAPGWKFLSWSGDLSGNTNPVLLTMNSSKQVIANFTQLPVTLTTEAVGQGSIQPSEGIYDTGTVINMQATPASGWVFSHWSGDLSGNTNPSPLTMNGNKHVIATFIPLLPVILAENADGPWISVVNSRKTGSQSFKIGTKGEPDYEITKIVLYLGYDQVPPDKVLLVKIGTGLNAGTLRQVSVSPSKLSNNLTPINIKFATPVGPLKSGVRYWINLKNKGTNGSGYLLHVSEKDVYPRGSYFDGLVKVNQDAKFQIWGHSLPGVQASMNTDREELLSGKIDIDEDEVPDTYNLSQNYPNPFNPETTIFYQLKSDAEITLKVFDLMGREVATLAQGLHRAGTYSVPWDGSGFSSGIYVYQLTMSSGSETFTEVKKMILLK